MSTLRGSKKLLAFVVVAISLVHSAGSLSATQPLSIGGSACKKVGQIRNTSAGSFKCRLVGNRRVWRRLVTSTTSTTSIAPESSGLDWSGMVTPRASLSDPKACKLSDATPNRVNTIAFPLPSERIPSTGSPKINVVYLDFPDGPARTEGFDPVDDFQKTFQRYADTYFEAMSFGTYKPRWSVHPTVKRFPRPATDYATPSGNRDTRIWVQFASDAIAYTDGEVDFSNSSAAIFIAHPDVPSGLINIESALPRPPSWGYPSNEGPIFNSFVVNPRNPNDTSWSSLVFVHEYGHLMGLVDLYAYPNSGMSQESPTGEFAMMGSGMPRAETIGWHRWLLNWLQDDEVRCVANPGNSVHALSPISSQNRGEKLVVVPRSPTRAVVVEAKRPDRFCVGCINGIQVYTVDISVEGGRGPIQIVVRPGQQRPPTVKNAILTRGESVTVDGVSVTVTDSGALGELVTVVRP
jgi:M6 family metalloprotease-like protein